MTFDITLCVCFVSEQLQQFYLRYNSTDSPPVTKSVRAELTLFTGHWLASESQRDDGLFLFFPFSLRVFLQVDWLLVAGPALLRTETDWIWSRAVASDRSESAQLAFVS